MSSSIIYFTTILTDDSTMLSSTSSSSSPFHAPGWYLWYAEYGVEYIDIGILMDVVIFTSRLKLQQWVAVPHVEDGIQCSANT